jgi:hypothetical protein
LNGKLISVFFILVMALGLLPLLGTQNYIASAQDTGGYYEDLVPIQGHYLRAINTYPGVTPDSDEDGVLDKGCSWDDNGDGVNEQHVVRDPLIVDLEANGFSPGDNVMISYKESIYAASGDIFGLHVYGLFSSSKELTREDYTYTSSSGEGWPMVGPLNRVPGAIDAALGGYTHGPQDDTNTWKQGQEVENDIPQDFRITGYQETNGWKNYDSWSQDKVWYSTGFWIQIPPGAKFLFFEVAGGYWNVGDAGYCRIKVDKDTDYDAIPDSWESNGIDFNWDGTVDLKLVGADYLKKDIFVEVDYLEGHRFSALAADEVTRAFSSCPVTVRNGPIAIHIEVDDSNRIPHAEYIKFPNDFRDLKSQYFGTTTQRAGLNSKYVLLAKSYAYHYCIFAHNYQYLDKNFWTRTTSGGMGEVNGNDFMITLGNWTDGVGSLDEQARTFMHELGHNLGLQHGGNDKVNYKPNYMSIMNYMFSDDSLRKWPLTYSSKKMPDLDESNLNELRGVAGANWDYSAFSTSILRADGKGYIPRIIETYYAVDWNTNRFSNDTSVQVNINNFPQWGYRSIEGEILHGFDDWSNLFFYFIKDAGFAGAFEHMDIDDIEKTWETVQIMREDAKNMEGPNEPVHIIDPSYQTSSTSQTNSPQSTTPGSQTTNPFFIFADQALSFVKTNPILVIVAVVVVLSLIIVSSIVKRKSKHKPEQPTVSKS